MKKKEAPKKDPSLKKLSELNAQALLGGGTERLKKQKENDRLTARERLAVLLDDDTFVEMDRFGVHHCQSFGMQDKKILGDGVITGYGKVNGQTVFVYSQDFTVFGGSMSRTQARKITKIQKLALKNGCPIIGLNDSGGARIQEGVESLGGYGDIFLQNTLASGVIPQISAIMGPCAGGAVYSPSLTDFIFMVEKSSYMFITGPDVVKSVNHEDVSKEVLGGPETHTQKSGVTHFSYPDDKSCLLGIRKLLSFLPPNNMELPPVEKISDPVDRKDDSLNGIIPENPKKPYDMREIVLKTCDEHSFWEIQKDYATNIIIGLARYNGTTVGIVANQPKSLAGCLDIAASKKAARFVRFCNAFNISLVSFVDVPGFLPGKDQEWNGIITHGAKLLYAYCEATVPKVTLVTRKAYGGAYIVMSSKHIRGDVNLAYPGAEIAVMGGEGAVNIIFRKELKKPGGDSKEKLLKAYEDQFSNPYIASELGYIDEIIEPIETRQKIISSLEMLKNKRDTMPSKKHGNIPL